MWDNNHILTSKWSSSVLQYLILGLDRLLTKIKCVGHFVHRNTSAHIEQFGERGC